MKPPILLIHGAFSSASHLAGWANFFREHGFACATPALPGHSAEDAERIGSLTMGDYFDALRDEMSRLPEAPILIGHSMGGLLAQQLASLQPCRALICVASLPPWMLIPPLHALPYFLPLLPAVLSGQPVRPGKSAFRHLLLNGLSVEEREAILPTLGGDSGKAFRAILLGLVRLGGRRITCPVLCLNAKSDRIVSLSTQNAIARLHGADHETFDTGHWLVAPSLVDHVAGHALSWIERRL